MRVIDTPGTYDFTGETIDGLEIRSDDVTITAEPGTCITNSFIDGESRTYAIGFEGDSTQRCTIQNIELVGSGFLSNQHSSLINQRSGDCSGLHVVNCLLRDATFTSLRLSHGSNINIIGCEFKDIGPTDTEAIHYEFAQLISDLPNYLEIKFENCVFRYSDPDPRPDDPDFGLGISTGQNTDLLMTKCVFQNIWNPIMNHPTPSNDGRKHTYTYCHFDNCGPFQDQVDENRYNIVGCMFTNVRYRPYASWLADINRNNKFGNECAEEIDKYTGKDSWPQPFTFGVDCGYADISPPMITPKWDGSVIDPPDEIEPDPVLPPVNSIEDRVLLLEQEIESINAWLNDVRNSWMGDAYESEATSN